jgi:hypothetical protein
MITVSTVGTLSFSSLVYTTSNKPATNCKDINQKFITTGRKRQNGLHVCLLYVTPKSISISNFVKVILAGRLPTAL